MNADLRNQDIRWLLLYSMREARKAGLAQSGGWLSEIMILAIMGRHGYELSADEMREEMEYLVDKRCAASEPVSGRINKYRILPLGVDVIEGTARIPGIGIAARRGE